jgi:hypothetical protein
LITHTSGVIPERWRSGVLVVIGLVLVVWAWRLPARRR